MDRMNGMGRQGETDDGGYLKQRQQQQCLFIEDVIRSLHINGKSTNTALRDE